METKKTPQMKKARAMEENIASYVDEKLNYETMTSSRELEVADEISHPIYLMPTNQLTKRLDSQATICNITICGIKEKQKVCSGQLNNKYLNSLKWDRAFNMLKGGTLGAMWTKLEQHTDLKYGTIKWIKSCPFPSEGQYQRQS
jgi:hypothetical protein